MNDMILLVKRRQNDQLQDFQVQLISVCSLTNSASNVASNEFFIYVAYKCVFNISNAFLRFLNVNSIYVIYRCDLNYVI